MDILDSLEIRWFLAREDSATAALQKWFVAVKDEGERTDHYLATGRDDLAFKARLAAGKPAKVETKYLVGALGTVELTPSMTGYLERWTKLSLPVSDVELRQHGAWLAVKKTRQLRKFSVNLAKAPTAAEVSVDEIVPAGCGVELTRLDYDVAATSRVEWTFGLEAFGPAARLLDVLRSTVEVIAAGGALPALQSVSSMSYATWLLALMV